MSNKLFRIAVGCDHAGFLYKTKIAERLRELGHEVVDFGTYSTDPVDYPLVGFKVGEAVASGDFERGVLVCGSSLGIAIAANKVKGIRAVPITEPYSAHLSRSHNDANIICFGERLTGGRWSKSVLTSGCTPKQKAGATHGAWANSTTTIRRRSASSSERAAARTVGVGQR
jgi:ribose 5-phosphate isomerase B